MYLSFIIIQVPQDLVDSFKIDYYDHEYVLC